MLSLPVIYLILGLYFANTDSYSYSFKSSRTSSSSQALHPSSTSVSFSSRGRGRDRGRQRQFKVYSGYVPPELDPEYRDLVVRPRLTASTSTKSKQGVAFNQTDIDEATGKLYPAPKEGDIVQYKGRWGEMDIGRIRFLQYAKQYESFYADIVPMKLSTSENTYVLDKSSKAEYLSLKELAPVKFYFIRSDNGYKIYRKKENQTEIVLKATRYREVGGSYNPRSKAIDFNKLKGGMEDYAVLKLRIVKSSLKFGIIFAVIAAVAFNVETAAVYALGVIGGALYLYLLGINIDSIGVKYSAVPLIPKDLNSTTGTESESGGSEQQKELKKRVLTALSKIRLLVPLLAIGIIAKSNKIGLFPVSTNDLQFIPQNLKLIPQVQYIALMAGFTTNRISVFIDEVTKEIRTEDFLGFLPGSVGIGLREGLLKPKEEAKPVEEEEDQDPVYPLIFATGPASAGRNSLMSSVLRLPEVSRERDQKRFRFCKLLTTDSQYTGRTSDWYEYVSPDRLKNLRQVTGEILYEGEERDETGRRIPVLLTSSSFTAAMLGASVGAEEEYETSLVMIGPPQMLDALSAQENVVLTSLWISLQTKAQFTSMATRMISQGVSASRSGSGEVLDSDVKELVDSAVSDISYYMKKTSKFDHTILNVDEPGSIDGTATKDIQNIILS